MSAKLTYFYLLFCVACCLASSCTSDTSDSVEFSKEGSEMSFDVATFSRASVTSSLDRFAVYGDMKFQGNNDIAPIVVFNKTEVEYKDGSWSYQGTQYWFPKYEYSFVAIYPLSVLEADNKPRYSDSKLSFTYTIPTTGNNVVSDNDVVDIVAATHRRLYNQDDTNTTTTFTFSHILSLINLAPSLHDNVMNQEEYIELRKLELSGFKTQATFNILPASRQSSNQTDDFVIDVTGQEGEGKLAIEFTEPVKVKNNGEYVNLFDSHDAIIMLPQAFAVDSDAKIIVSYTINTDPSIKQITLPLMSQQWEWGKSYTYKFTIDRTGLLSESTTITDWDVMNAGSINAH